MSVKKGDESPLFTVQHWEQNFSADEPEKCIDNFFFEILQKSWNGKTPNLNAVIIFSSWGVLVKLKEKPVNVANMAPGGEVERDSKKIYQIDVRGEECPKLQWTCPLKSK